MDFGKIIKVKPILFNTEMVQVILEDWKTATRRAVKGFIPSDAMWGYTHFTPKGCISCRGTFADGYGEKFFKLPCMPGDILYIRETWAFKCCIDCIHGGDDEECRIAKIPIIYEDEDSISDGCYIYRADYPCPERAVWRPSIHMPKAAARLWLKVTDVRVERLQDMRLDDFLNEGVTLRSESFNDPENAYLQARSVFIAIWDSTVKKADVCWYSWSADPWVWVIEFERRKKPEGCNC